MNGGEDHSGVVDVCIQYLTHEFCMVEGGGTLTSCDTGSHVMSLHNLAGVKSVQPQSHHMISNIKEGDSAPMGDTWIVSTE